MGNWRDYVENILVAIFLALVVRTFILTGYKVPTGSMAPTLLPGDFIFAFRLPYGVKIPLSQFKTSAAVPDRGTLIVFSYPDQPHITYVKRVIGLPGDRIQVENDVLVLNGQKATYREISVDDNSGSKALGPGMMNPDFFKLVEENIGPQSWHLIMQKTDAKKGGLNHNFGPFIVPPNEVFVLGDNRDSSDDSRYWGSVPIARIDGRVILVWLSLDWRDKFWDNRFPTLRWERMGLVPK
ncbi:MAG: signal peptidase I [Bdellovibrio sp. CG10_big_fil_rev_8_21_14_0_10_47_8]|nr:MAG: signal peptidase I [Bdellovibrio sp. CG10_big_fil_rev_8_21_14_0_10_47_8]